MTASCSGLVKDLLLIWLPSSPKLMPHKSVNGLTGSTHHKHLHESVLDPDPAAVRVRKTPCSCSSGSSLHFSQRFPALRAAGGKSTEKFKAYEILDATPLRQQGWLMLSRALALLLFCVLPLILTDSLHPSISCVPHENVSFFSLLSSSVRLT